MLNRVSAHCFQFLLQTLIQQHQRFERGMHITATCGDDLVNLLLVFVKKISGVRA
jgi:hypothetical protein